MDNIKTGNLIRELRKEKSMTQKDLADLLHITDRAVSKWERGLCAPDISLLEPLAELLNVNVTELISGECNMEEIKGVEEKVIEAINYSEKEVVKKTMFYKKRLVIVSIIAFVILAFSIISNWFPVILQRGNPFPYISAAIQIDSDSPYAKVDVEEAADVFISLRVRGSSDECEALFYDVAYSKGYEFVEQAGSGYIFSDGKNSMVISSEIYLKYFMVWKVPNSTLEE